MMNHPSSNQHSSHQDGSHGDDRLHKTQDEEQQHHQMYVNEAPLSLVDPEMTRRLMPNQQE